MEQRILPYIISLLLVLCSALPLRGQGTLNDPRGGERIGSEKAQEAQRKQKKERERTPAEIEYPLFSGISVGVDLIQPLKKVLGSDYYGFEAQGTINLKGRFFPTLELGYGKSDMIDTNKDIIYKASAPYTRLGIDYNFLYKKAHGNQVLVGLRYGFTSMTYDIIDPYEGGFSWRANIEDKIWEEQLPFSHTGMKSTMHWLEFTAGIRAKVWRSIHMGWSLRFRYKLSASTGEFGNPYYVPGYGRYGNNTIGVTYHLIYLLPFKKK